MILKLLLHLYLLLLQILLQQLLLLLLKSLLQQLLLPYPRFPCAMLLQLRQLPPLTLFQLPLLCRTLVLEPLAAFVNSAVSFRNQLFGFFQGRRFDARAKAKVHVRDPSPTALTQVECRHHQY